MNSSLITEVANTLKEVGSTTSKTGKEEILRSNNSNTLLGEVLNHIFNPFIKTNIAKKKLAKDVRKSDPSISIKSFEEYMSFLRVSTGKDEQIFAVQQYIKSQPEEIHWLLEAMATKDLKIGATSSTINKAFGEGFIPTFDLMLAEKWVEVKKSKGVEKTFEHWRTMIGKKVIATPKLDGNRAVVFVEDDGSVKFLSREGHEFTDFNELAEAFGKYPRGQVYDGEFLATNEEGLNSQDLFSKTSSLVKKKQKKKVGMEFHAFDMLSIASFKQGGCNVPCEERKSTLKLVVETQNNLLIKYVEPLYIGEFDFELLEQLAEEAKDNEEEGIMVQLADEKYECRRTRGILKYKSFESADVICLDVYEGKSGKNIDRLGGLVLNYKGNTVNVGGGFSDEQRITYWNNKNLVLGKIIEIKYFEEFVDEDGTLDLRFATFKTIREDKSEESYY